MSEVEEVDGVLNVLEKVKDFREIADNCCNDLVNVVIDLVKKVQDNRKTIGQLLEEIKNNQKVIEVFESKSKVNYEVEEDGFTNLELKKVNK